jgi:iron complex transport system permease protein
MRHRTLWFFLSSCLLFGIAFVIALTVGRYRIDFATFFPAVFGSDPAYDMERSIIVNLRLPRTIMAGLTGVALALSGLLYQETFQNKLTSPDLLGVSAGSAVGAALAILLGLSAVFISVFAFAFGVLTVFLTVLVAKMFRNGSSTILLLAGIIVGGLMSAVMTIIKYSAPDDSILASIAYWLMGSFSNSTMESVWIFLPIVGACSICLLLIRQKINLVSLGREEAQTKGMNYALYRYLIIGIATLMTATSVAFSGTISWIGLVIPHIVRLLVGRDAKKTIPLCISFGGLFMIVVDILSRTFTPAEIPLSGITGLFGTVIFVGILFYRRREYDEH